MLVCILLSKPGEELLQSPFGSSLCVLGNNRFGNAFHLLLAESLENEILFLGWWLNDLRVGQELRAFVSTFEQMYNESLHEYLRL